MTLIARSAAAALVGLLVLGPSAVASAHTDSDVVAVPAGGEATVRFEPTHGCEGSPTVEVSVRAPVEGATAGAVEGWTTSATPDGEGNTVLTWTGGLLPADQTGAFPVTFTAPGTPGELLTFAALQNCENGEELAWISGDPESEYPAPRLLILPGGAAPAATIEDVPADAPGREQLTAIVDVDGPGAEEPSETSSPDGSTTTAAPTTAAPAPDADDEAGATVPAAADDDADDGGSGPLLAGIAAVVVAGAGGAYLLLRRRPSP